MRGNIFKWGLFSALCSVGFFGLMILAGDDDPYNPMPLGKWFILKAFGASLIYAAYRVGKLLDRHNLLPDNLNDIDKEDEL